MEDGTLDYRQIAQLKAQDDLPEVKKEKLVRMIRAARVPYDHKRPRERTKAIVALVKLHAETDLHGAQTRVAEILGVSRTVVSRHIVKEREWWIVDDVRAHLASLEDARVDALWWTVVDVNKGRLSARTGNRSRVTIEATRSPAGAWEVLAVKPCGECGKTYRRKLRNADSLTRAENHVCHK